MMKTLRDRDVEAQRALVHSVHYEGRDGGEIAGYLARDWRRFILTWQLCADVEGQALELGAGPYFTTVLLREGGLLDLTLTNYFGDGFAKGEDRIIYDSRRFPDDPVHVMAYDNFNVEGDRFPYDDNSFDLVLLCEVLEHLTHDPLLALREIHRVLKPGGRLVLTTPNVASLRNLVRLARGGNVHDRYSGYGPYGRHNREYTLGEVERLLAHCGLMTQQGFTANVKPSRWPMRLLEGMVRLLSRRRWRTLGQYLFVAAVKSGEARPGRPDWLYRSFEDTT